MKSKYLPIGSIVTLKGINKKIMVIGYYSIKYQNVVKMYDYLGCSYPEGLLILNNVYSFNHSDIVDTLFEGFTDESFEVLKNNLLSQLDNDTENYTKKENFVNLKYDDNGVVVYNDLVELGVGSEIYNIFDSINNPFKKEKINNESNVVEPLVSDVIEDTLDNESIENQKDIERNFIINEPDEPTDEEIEMPHYKFNDDGIEIE